MVWANLKIQCLANYCPKSTEGLWAATEPEMNRMRTRP